MARYEEANVDLDPGLSPLQPGLGQTRPNLRPGVALTKDNATAAVAPTVNDDSTLGYVPGSRWIDTVGQQEYVCISSVVGAALWKQTT